MGLQKLMGGAQQLVLIARMGKSLIILLLTCGMEPSQAAVSRRRKLPPQAEGWWSERASVSLHSVAPAMSTSWCVRAYKKARTILGSI